MKVVFQNPPVPHSKDPFNDFCPSNIDHYPTGAGVYIYGLRIEVDGEKKFVPLYVGTAKDLNVRLFNGHYSKLSYPDLKDKKTKSYGKSLKELWDFSAKKFLVTDIQKRYTEMDVYDGYPKNEKHEMWRMITLNHLIWFQNLCFYCRKFSSHDFSCTDSNHLDTINKYFPQALKRNPSLITLVSDTKTKIIETKKKFNSDFYFVYASLLPQSEEPNHVIIEQNDILKKEHKNFREANNYKEKGRNGKSLAGEKIAEEIEKATKDALKEININTTAKASGELSYEIEIDLNEIQDNLINVGGHRYGNPYIKPLIL